MAGTEDIVTIKINVRTGEVIDVEPPSNGKIVDSPPPDEPIPMKELKYVKSFAGFAALTNPTCYYYWWDGTRLWVIMYPC